MLPPDDYTLDIPCILPPLNTSKRPVLLTSPLQNSVHFSCLVVPNF
jgi:hypothetical protein